MSLGSLHGRVALITGGGSGIGAAVAGELAANGMKLAIMGRREAPLREVADSIGREGGRCLAIPGDVRDAHEVDGAVSRTIEELGGLDTLVACAALVDHDPIDRADPGRWADVITTNVLGVMYAVRMCLPRMLETGVGHIVIVASASGRVTYVGEPAYVASKHAVVAFADCLRKETVGRGIRVTAVEPGLVDTPFIDWDVVGPMQPGVTPLTAEDCARIVRFAIEQPPNVVLNEIVVRPISQGL